MLDFNNFLFCNPTKKTHFYLQILKYLHYVIIVPFGMNIISNEDEFVTFLVQLLFSLLITNVSIFHPPSITSSCMLPHQNWAGAFCN